VLLLRQNGKGKLKTAIFIRGGAKMETLKQEAIKAISKLPDSANIDDIMYELYVIDKVKKGREAAERGESLSVEELKREMQSW
jgi:hypothetical protein